MSIFESKEFWSTTLSHNEEFDGNSICIGNIDNDPNGINKICVSSFKGVLRFYEPKFNSSSSQNILYEKAYDSPMLQIDLGNYIINSSDKQIGILQSKAFFVIQVSNLHGATHLKLCYDHKLKRNGHNFTRGRLGEKNYDLVFVQSIDGAISIYEQDSLINSISFSEVFFPGSIAFLSKTDSFIISNTSYEIECYNYNNLATIKKGSEKNEMKITHQWVSNIGELTKDIQVISNELNKKQEIVILSETLLNLLDSNGKIFYQKKLDYEPMAFRVYNVTDPNYVPNKLFDLMCMISSSLNHVLVYKGVNLAWAVKIFDTSLYLNFSDFDNVNKLIVSLGDNGRMSVFYLGTEVTKNQFIVQSKPLDQNFLINETQRLSHLIDNYSKGVVMESETSLSISAEVNERVFYDEESSDNIFYKDHYGKIIRGVVTLIFSYDGVCAQDIRVNIIVPYNVICDDPIFTITSLTKSNNTIKKVINFRVISDLYPTFTSIDVYASYYIKNDERKKDRTFQSTSFTLELPLPLFIRLSQDNKKSEASSKITLMTNKNQLKMDEIFSDLTHDFIDSDLIKGKPLSITFIYPNKAEATIIISKSSGRYRIQSNYFEALLFITHQIIMRINEHYQYDVEFYIEDPINFQKYFGLVNTHYTLIENKKKLNQELEKYSALYTTVQKSLLNKYKEKNPPQLYNLDFLLKQIHKEINAKSDDILKIDNEIRFNHRDIVIWTELMIYLLKLRSKMSEDHYQTVRCAFPLDNINENENSWEEVTLTNMGNMILYYFKNERKNLQEFKELTDLDKWNKYFIALFKEIIAHKGLKEKIEN